MKFVTFQDTYAVSQLNNKGVYEIEEFYKDQNCTGIGSEVLESRIEYRPIFAFPLLNKRDFYTRLMIEYPTLPKQMIIFSSDTYNTVGYVKWLQLLNRLTAEKFGKRYSLDIKAEDLEIDNKKVFSEYIVPKVELKNVKKIIKLTDNLNTDRYLGPTVNDDFIARIFDGTITKAISKYLPKDNVRLLDCGLDSIQKAKVTEIMLADLNERTEHLNELRMREIYSYIRTNYVR